MTNFQCETQNGETHISAVILDLDGTLLNTEQATKGVLGELLERYGKVLDREKEDKRLGMIHEEFAMAIVEDYELPITPGCFSQEIMPMYYEKWVQAKALPGANRLIQHLHKHGVPFALASNSRRKSIDIKISNQQVWREYFSVILGSDQVKSGKPSPDIFLEAANKMGVDAIHCLVIEDSLTGVKAGKAAGMKVVAVPTLQNAAEKYSIADSVLHSLLEFRPELWGLPPFEDWVDNALPIEPFYLKGSCSSGLLYLTSDSGESPLPDQAFGLYFGWAKFGTHKIMVVASIGWDHGCCTCKRKIQIHLLDGSNEHKCNPQVQILLVGYIRGLTNEESKAGNIVIPEEDKSIARAALDLPAFGYHTSLPVSP
ncbi:bifunctional riboflavin kinase/FMN phosphatase-like isoform X2 [Actinidia eriantha]|uniref:bifunctional riboflavin kinase/FMN phosphatase-like isoform X2 n=1 Tax=Actinidia eriantha TaxID=165200 RepID=UPI00258D037E|nr:bifunctional riboflavin kinase/FMN phosphatase-like isoform X2 [Actinidia eriantha]